jgi:hypothetical protein
VAVDAEPHQLQELGQGVQHDLVARGSNGAAMLASDAFSPHRPPR